MSQSASPGPFNLHWIIGTVGAAVITGVFAQTVNIQDWRIIRIEFHDGQAFC